MSELLPFFFLTRIFAYANLLAIVARVVKAQQMLQLLERTLAASVKHELRSGGSMKLNILLTVMAGSRLLVLAAHVEPADDTSATTSATGSSLGLI